MEEPVARVLEIDVQLLIGGDQLFIDPDHLLDLHLESVDLGLELSNKLHFLLIQDLILLHIPLPNKPLLLFVELLFLLPQRDDMEILNIIDISLMLDNL